MGDGLRVRENRPLRFASFTLDLDGCTLTDPQGKPIDLTRGEFVMLRTFAQQPGRVLSRDALLDAVAGRRGDSFDRSVDMMVGRLRRKIEPDPKQPKLVVTVPGLGYKFCATVEVCAATLPAAAPDPCDVAGVAPQAPRARQEPGRRVVLVGGAAAAAGVALAAAWLSRPRPVSEAAAPVRITVLPFTNVSGDSAEDYFADGVAVHLAIQLGTFPTMQVVAAPTSQIAKEHGAVEAARSVGAEYALQGALVKGVDKVTITAQLFDTRTGLGMWADRFDATSADMLALQEDIADRIYQSVSGFRGIVYQAGMRDAWRKATPSLGEYDYAVRGHAFYFRFTKPDVMAAREIWQEGLRRFPNSALLRTKIAISYMWAFMNYASDDIDGDVARAWDLLQESDRMEPKSALVAYLNHWILAIVYQWRGEDFTHSITEAREALRIAPYDTLLRMDVSWCLANAGLADEAVAHARWGVEHTPNPPAWFFGNLAWAYFVAARYPETLDAARQAGDELTLLRSATLVRLGRVEEARPVMTIWRHANPHDNVVAEARWPLVEPLKAAFIRDLRIAGLPET